MTLRGFPPHPRPRGQPFPSYAPHGRPYLQPEEEGPLPTPRPAPPAQRPRRRPRGPARRRAARVPCTPDRARLPASSAAAAQSHSPPPVSRSVRKTVAQSRRRRDSPTAGVLAEKCPSPWRRGARRPPLSREGTAKDSLGDLDRPRHPTALTANPSRARDASARPPPPASRPLRRGRRPTASSESAGRLARARGGASGRPGLWETSASGAAAIATLGSTGPQSCAQELTPAPTVPESRPPSLRRPPPEPVMLEHLSSLPTQMVRALPASAPRFLHAAREPGSSATLVRDPPRCTAVPTPDGYFLPPKESPGSPSLFPREDAPARVP